MYIPCKMHYHIRSQIPIVSSSVQEIVENDEKTGLKLTENTHLFLAFTFTQKVWQKKNQDWIITLFCREHIKRLNGIYLENVFLFLFYICIQKPQSVGLSISNHRKWWNIFQLRHLILKAYKLWSNFMIMICPSLKWVFGNHNTYLASMLPFYLQFHIGLLKCCVYIIMLHY